MSNNIWYCGAKEPTDIHDFLKRFLIKKTVLLIDNACSEVYINTITPTWTLSPNSLWLTRDTDNTQ